MGKNRGVTFVTPFVSSLVSCQNQKLDHQKEEGKGRCIGLSTEDEQQDARCMNR